MADGSTLPILLRQLRLPTMAACYEIIAEQANTHSWPLDRNLATLCEYQLAERDRRRLQRHLKEARLLGGKTIDTFDFGAIGGADRPQLTQLATDTGWIERCQNLLLFGASGVGNSHIAAAIGRALIEQGLRVRYYSASALVQKLQAAKRALVLPETLTKMDKYRLLIIADIGYIKRDEAETTVLFALIAHRHEAGSVVITPNQSLSAWDTIFQEDMMAVAAINRLIHHAHIVELNGESYRKKTHHRRTCKSTA